MKNVGVVVLVAVVFFVIGWVTITVWNECRSEGHSVLYCLKLVSR